MPSIVDVADHNRYEARDEHDQLLGVIEYHRTPATITFTHTEVLPAAEGQGVGSTLARYVLDQARTDGLSVVPLCPFIRGWIDRHPDYADLVTSPTTS